MRAAMQVVPQPYNFIRFRISLTIIVVTSTQDGHNLLIPLLLSCLDGLDHRRMHN